VGGTATQSRQLEALAARVEQVDAGPAVIYVQSVEGCPYTCAMCTARGTKPVEISSDILAQLEPYFADTEIVAIHGNGEPLLGDLDYFVRQAETHGFVLHMNTTGFFLTRRVAELLLRARLSVRFSIHAATPETYTQERRLSGGASSRVRARARSLVQLHRDEGEPRRNRRVPSTGPEVRGRKRPVHEALPQSTDDQGDQNEGPRLPL